MKWMLARSLNLVMLIASILSFGPPDAKAQEKAHEGPPIAVATWQIEGEQTFLLVPFLALLTSKQLNMINGGFTTLSQVELYTQAEAAKPADTRRPLYELRCSVKYDAWLENYDVARLDGAPQAAVLKELLDYAKMCLTTKLKTSELTEPWKSEGGTLTAVLIVKQTSVDEAGKIREWLIRQQSGVMQSLFSHMLGELALNQALTLRVKIPPLTQHAENPRRSPNHRETSQ